MRIFGFNTGRQYQSDGQRISVAITEEGDVLFRDHSRGIDGKLRWYRDLDGTNYRPAVVMEYYDHGQYDYDSRASFIEAKEWPAAQI